MDRRKFIITCASCAITGCGAVLLKNRTHSSFNSISVHLAEHCNLSCKYCRHFSCIAEKEFYDLDKFKQDIRQMSLVFNKKLENLYLMGGEPLLNPDINEYVKVSREYFPKTKISITTNSILLDDMNESFWKTLNENNVPITLSIYPIEINWKSILEKSKKYNVGIRSILNTGRRLAIDNIDKLQINTFLKKELDINGELQERPVECNAKIDNTTMHHGRLYPCSTIAFIKHLNKKFNTNFIVTSEDYIDLYKTKNVTEVLNFINSNMPFCRYCGSEVKVKWESSLEHSVYEWIKET